MADTKIKDLTEKAVGVATDEFPINDVTGGDLDRKMGMDGLRITESQITDLQSYLLNITAEPIGDLSDVTITAIAANEILKWNGSAFINNTLAEAGISATGHSHILTDVTDVTITVANLNILDDGADTTLHFHDSDRARANHTGTQTISTLSDLDTGTVTFSNKTIDGDVNTIIDINETQMNVSVGSSGTILTSNGVGVAPTYQAAGGANHDLLSATHSDTLASAVSEGSIILGNSTPAYAELAIGGNANLLISNGTTLAYGFVNDVNIGSSAAILVNKLENGVNSFFVRGTGLSGCVLEAINISRGGTVLDPDVRNIIVWRAPFTCTVTNVRGYRVGGTTASINARRNGTSNHLASDNVIGTADVWDDGGAVQNIAYAVGDKLEIMITVVTGSPTQVAVQVDFRRP